MGNNSSRKDKKLPQQPPGFPMGVHDSRREDGSCRCGACLTGIKRSTAAKIGRKAEAAAASEVPKRGKK